MCVSVLGMTDIRISTAEAVSAALHVYADAIRLGQVPTPNYITLHTAAMAPKAFMALADRIDALIEIVTPGDDDTWPPYARIKLPFGADILPTSITTNVHVTCSRLDERVREDIETHNDECIGLRIDQAAAEGRGTMGTGNVNNDDEESLNFADEGDYLA
jgi:hypothetical protein